MNRNSLLPLSIIKAIVRDLFNLKIICIQFVILTVIFGSISVATTSHAQDSLSDNLNSSSTILSQSGPGNRNMSEMLQRRNIAMGFDQTQISHEFTATKNGGQIKITALEDKDQQTIKQIQSHTRDIQNDFTAGDFTKPFYIHALSVPGTDDMSQNKEQIHYQIQDLKNGSILILITNNSNLVSSINQFMTFQSTEHTGH